MSLASTRRNGSPRHLTAAKGLYIAKGNSHRYWYVNATRYGEWLYILDQVWTSPGTSMWWEAGEGCWFLFKWTLMMMRQPLREGYRKQSPLKSGSSSRVQQLSHHGTVSSPHLPLTLYPLSVPAPSILLPFTAKLFERAVRHSVSTFFPPIPFSKPTPIALLIPQYTEIVLVEVFPDHHIAPSSGDFTSLSLLSAAFLTDNPLPSSWNSSSLASGTPHS